MSRFSMMYPVSGEPPSDLGGFQESDTLSAVMSEATRGPSGGEGLSDAGKATDNVNTVSN